jgi:isoleucyl-tRNA synthetase
MCGLTVVTYNTHGYQNKDKIDANKDFPGDFIAEGVDQTRGWFYTLHAIATLVLIKWPIKCSFKWTSSECRKRLGKQNLLKH